MSEATDLTGQTPHGGRTERHERTLPVVVGALTDTPVSDVVHVTEDITEVTADASDTATDIATGRADAAVALGVPPASLPSRAPVGAGGRFTRDAVRARVHELAKFGSVGAVSFVVDLGLFNLLRFGPGQLLHDKPITAKVVSVAVATLVAWIGNRHWTFSDRRTKNRPRELVGFLVINVGGMLIAIACLWFSHYVLGFTSALADNIAANVVGLGLGTIFRYVAYRRFVFTGLTGQDLSEPDRSPTPSSS